jgi:membrane-associated phospholipid phosphatase
MLELAIFVSRIFEPAFVFAAVFLVGAIRTGVFIYDSLIWLALVLIPTLWYRWWAKKHQDLDWDIQDRTRRIKPLAILLGFLTIFTLAVSFSEPRLIELCVLVLCWGLGFFVLTTFWTKISGHTGVIALATGLLVAWFGGAWWISLFLVGAVGWARIVTRNHTPIQVVAGAVYSWVVVALFYS